jgi:hypothetical protein
MPIHPVLNLEYTEGWIKVPGFSNYEINSCSQVRNKKTEHVLKPNNQYRVTLRDDLGQQRGMSTYRLALMSFFPTLTPDVDDTVDHIDENRHNNNLSNLQWLSRGDQVRKSNVIKPRNAGRATSKPVEQWSSDNKSLIATFLSSYEATKITGICASHIRECVRSIRKSAGGFFWKGASCLSQNDLPHEQWKSSPLLIEQLCTKGLSLRSAQKVKVSNLGRVMTAAGMKTFGKPEGRSSLYRMYRGYLVHQLVWTVWGNGSKPPQKGSNLVICHDDTVPLDKDGCVSNAIAHLRIDTKSANVKECHAVGRRAAKKRMHSDL